MILLTTERKKLNHVLMLTPERLSFSVLATFGSVPWPRRDCHSQGRDEVLPLIVGPSQQGGMNVTVEPERNNVTLVRGLTGTHSGMPEHSRGGLGGLVFLGQPARRGQTWVI